MVQLSLRSLVVPVLTATSGWLRMLRFEPKLGALAFWSERMCVVRYGACGLRIRSASQPSLKRRSASGSVRAAISGGWQLNSSRTLPVESVTFKMGWSGTLIPRLARLE